MNREQAIELIKTYKNFPESKIFSLKPTNYPLFHLMECFAKGWQIHYLHDWGGMDRVENIDFEKLADELIHYPFPGIWRYVARNPKLTNTTLGFVQADLYARYVGRCNPLKGPTTTWIFIPKNEAVREGFNGKTGKHTQLYLMEIDLDITDIVGKRDDKVPWHYLQQTIEWKPWKGTIDWQERDGDNVVNIVAEGLGPETLRQRFARLIRG